MKEYAFTAIGLKYKTMTVAELKNKLAEYPDDMPIFAEWEGCLVPITGEFFEVKPSPEIFRWTPDDGPLDCLIIDVNGY